MPPGDTHARFLGWCVDMDMSSTVCYVTEQRLECGHTCTMQSGMQGARALLARKAVHHPSLRFLQRITPP